MAATPSRAPEVELGEALAAREGIAAPGAEKVAAPRLAPAGDEASP